MQKKIVVLNPSIKGECEDKIREAAKKYGYEIHFHKDIQKASEDAADAEILYGHRDDFIRAGKEARWICASSAGVNTILKKGIIQRDDCILTNSSGSYGLTISEHLIMVALMLLRRMDYYDQAARERRWPEYVPIRSLKDSRITIAGTGDLGSNFARRLKGFEPASITGINRSGKCDEPAFDRILTSDRTEEVLPETDILALCLPSTPETAGFLSAERIGLLGPGAYVLNVGRGDAVDQTALVKALNEEKIAGAALDVFEAEPVPSGDPVWTAKNCIITPHCSGNMSLEYTVRKNTAMFLEDLDNYCAGRPMRYLVNKNRGY